MLIFARSLTFNMKHSFYLFIGLLFIFLSSCKSFFKVEIKIDNPTAYDLMVDFDNQTFVILPYESKDLSIIKGEHIFKASNNDVVVFDDVLNITSESLVNFTKSTYVIHKEIYVNEHESENADKYNEYANEALELSNVTIGNKTYKNVDFKVFEGDLLIEKDWDYGAIDNLPESISTNDNNYAVVSKLYRIADLEKAWGFYGEFDFTDKMDKELEYFIDSLQNSIKSIDTLIVDSLIE